MTAMMQQKS